MENKLEGELVKFKVPSNKKILNEVEMQHVLTSSAEVKIRKLQPHEINILSRLIRLGQQESADGAENMPTLPLEFLRLKENLYAECPDGLGTQLYTTNGRNFDHAVNMLAKDVLKDEITIHYKDCSVDQFSWLAELKEMWPEGLNLVVVSTEAWRFIGIMISALQSRRFPPGSSISLQRDKGKFPYIDGMIEMITKGDFPEDVELKLIFPNLPPEDMHKMSEAFASPKCPQGLRVELGNQYQEMVKFPKRFVRTLTGYATYPLSLHEARCSDSLERKSREPVSIREVRVLQRGEMLIRALMTHTSINSDPCTIILMFLPHMYINTKTINTQNWAAQIEADVRAKRNQSSALSKFGLYQEKPSDNEKDEEAELLRLSFMKEQESVIKTRFLGVKKVSMPFPTLLHITFECEELARDFTYILSGIPTTQNRTQVTIYGDDGVMQLSALLGECRIIEHNTGSNDLACEVIPRIMESHPRAPRFCGIM